MAEGPPGAVDPETEYEDGSWALLRFGNARLALVLPEQHPAHFSVSRVDAAAFGKLRTHRDGASHSTLVMHR